METANFNTVGGILTAETKNVSKEHETQLDALIKRCILNPNDPSIQEPQFMFSVNGVDVCPLGSLNAITGRAGVGKSIVCTLFVAAAIGGEISLSPDLRIEAKNQPKSLLWVDTEQHDYNIARQWRRIRATIGLPEDANPDALTPALQFLKLCPLKPETRLGVIERAVRTRRPDFVVIDGIRDLMEDINDSAEAEAVSQWILSLSDGELTDGNPVTVFYVLHSNKMGDDGVMRGHIGTEGMNKADNVFSVSKVKDPLAKGQPEAASRSAYFKVTTSKSRDLEAPDFALSIDGERIVSAYGLAQQMKEAEAERERDEAVEAIAKVGRGGDTFKSKRELADRLADICGGAKEAERVVETALRLGILQREQKGRVITIASEGEQ